MIPVSLVTGFLGSGKTTFLKRFIGRNRDRKIVYLVNEFSATDVDGRVLQDEEADLIALPGGSIFCRCLVTEFIAALRQIPVRFEEPGKPVEGVVIEASGVANPKVVERMLQETKLDQIFSLTSIISIVDPGTFSILAQTLPNILAQVESSDTILLNKVDQFDEEAIARTEDELRAIQADATILRTSYCDADLDLFAPRSGRALDGEYAACADPNYARMPVRLPNDVDLTRLAAALEAMGDVLYRAKGFVRAEGRVHHIDFSAGGLLIEAADDSDSPAQLAMIYSGAAFDRAKAFVKAVQDGEYDA
jgi:G3E family GTPase